MDQILNKEETKIVVSYQEEMKDVGLCHVASSGQDEDGESVADETWNADGHDGDALKPKAANRNCRLVVGRPRAADLVADVRL